MNPNQVMQELSCSFFHKKDSFLRRAVSAIPVVGTAVSFLPDFGGGNPASRSKFQPKPAFVARRKDGRCPGGYARIPGAGCRDPIQIPESFAASAPAANVGAVRPSSITSGGPCPGPFNVRGPGDTCIDLTALPPGGRPLITGRTGVTGQVVAGGFGLPAMAPEIEQRITRSCGPRMVLGIDDLCYPKAILPPRSQFRKWRRAPKPVISRRDEVAIRRAASAKERVLTLAKDVGLHASKTKPATKSKSSTLSQTDILALIASHT